MTYQEILEKALSKPTLTEALEFAAIVECDRVVRVILNSPKQYVEGKPYETCFGVFIRAILLNHPEVKAGFTPKG